MVAGVSATGLGCLLVAGAPAFGVAAAGIVLCGLAKPAFDVPMQGWFGARVPFARRSRVLGATELTWALGLVLTVPAGALIALTKLAGALRACGRGGRRRACRSHPAHRARLSDRFGLRRFVLGGLLGCAVAYTTLGLVGGSLVAGTVVVICWFVASEITSRGDDPVRVGARRRVPRPPSVAQPGGPSRFRTISSQPSGPIRSTATMPRR